MKLSIYYIQGMTRIMSEFRRSRERMNAPTTNSLIKLRSYLPPLTTTATTTYCPFIFVRGCTWQILTNSISSRTRRRAKNPSFVSSTCFFTQNRFIVDYAIPWSVEPAGFQIENLNASVANANAGGIGSKGRRQKERIVRIVRRVWKKRKRT